MKKIYGTIQEMRYRRLLKRLFEPRKEFLEISRRIFLTELAKRNAGLSVSQIRWSLIRVKGLRYAAAVAIVAVMGTSGLVAFADSQNVQATHPLYPFKRIGERVRLSVTPKQDKHLLHEEFAKRRAQEVRDMTAAVQKETDGVRDRHNAQIKKIGKEFKKDIEAIGAIPDVENRLSPMRMEALCNTKVEIESKIDDDDDTNVALKRFDDRCAAIANGDNGIATSTTH